MNSKGRNGFCWRGTALLLFSLTNAATAADVWPDLSSPAKGLGEGSKDAAVIVAVEDYNSVAPVPGARRNGNDWQTYLTASLGIPAERVSLLTNNEATLEKIRRFAAQAAADAKPGGTLWFIFIGHGAPSKDGRQGLLVGWDVQQEVDSLIARSLPEDELLRILASGKQSRTVVLLDACFSGRTQSGEELAPGLQPLVAVGNSRHSADRRALVMVAAKSDQFAGPLPRALTMRPAFSYLALGALQGWSADKDGDVTAGSIVDYARRALRLAHDRTQTPEITEGDRGTVLGHGARPGPDLAKIGRTMDRNPQVGQKVPAGSMPIEWVRIPSGSFMMGSDINEPNERPRHQVTIKAFEMARSLVTVKQYRACVDAGVCAPPDSSCMNLQRSFSDQQPVPCVNWDQARTFSEWVGGRLIPS